MVLVRCRCGVGHLLVLDLIHADAIASRTFQTEASGLVRVAVGKVIAHVAFVAAVAISVREVWGLDVILRTFTRRPRGRLAVLSLEATAGLRDTCTAVWAIHRLVVRTIGRNTNVTAPVGVPIARFDFVA